MKRIDTPTAVPDMFGPGKSGWRNGNKAQGIPATEFNADWPNNVQEEICAVIEAAGIALDGNNRAQLLQAIRGIISGRLATEEIAGIARIATEEEAAAGEDDGLIITPAKLANALQGVPQGNYKDVVLLQSSKVLTANDCSKAFLLGTATEAITVILPKTSEVPAGAKLVFASGAGTYPGNIQVADGDKITLKYGVADSIPFAPSCNYELVAEKTNNAWVIVSQDDIKTWRVVPKVTGVVYTNESGRMIQAMISGISASSTSLAIVEIEKTGDSGIYSRGLFYGKGVINTVGITASLSIAPGESYRYGVTNAANVIISEQTI